jgi:3-dehydroquinate synthase
MLTLEVSLGARSYPIYIGSGLLGSGLAADHLRSSRAMIVTNETVAPLFLDALQAALGDVSADVVALPDGERFKTLGTLEKLFDALVDGRHDRTTTLLALGGGVVGDMTGFAAACYQRGVDFIQVPTTLLAQVDSSVGGKTAVNHPRGKNMIGAFHQPVAVIIDTDVLASLPVREYRAGLAEVVKYGLIRDEPFFSWLEGNADALLQRDPEVLQEAIYRSCRNKAEVVAEDERESGNRALLNLGHTFGHAIETATGYGDWLHGEAVSAGMILAADMSVREGRMAASELQRMRALFERLELPVTPPAIGVERFLELMAHDKKVAHGQLRLILMEAVGRALVTGDFSQQALEDTLVACQ